MSRFKDIGNILKKYDERFQHNWNSFLEGFDEKYCSVLNSFDDTTKQRLVNGYIAVKENSERIKRKDPIEIYYMAIKKMLDIEKGKLDDQTIMRAYADSIEELVRSIK